MPGKNNSPPPPPPIPPPPPCTVITPPKPKESRRRQVAFAPLPAMSGAPSANPRHMSGHVTYHRPPQAPRDSGAGAGAGYVRVTGGSSTTTWRNYDASVPVRDFLAASQHQQNAILGAMDLAQNERARRHPSGRIVDVTDEEESQHKALAITGPERVLQLPKRAPSPTSVSKAATRVSHHSHSSHTSKASKRSNRSNKTVPVLTCVSCGQQKKPGVDNVKPIKAMADMPLCWKCVVEHMGSIGGEAWFSSAWVTN